MAKAESNEVKVEITDIDGEKITLMNIKQNGSAGVMLTLPFFFHSILQMKPPAFL